MQDAVDFIPLATMTLSLFFGTAVYRRYRAKVRAGSSSSLHLLWWAFGIFTFGAGTFAEGFTTLFGWHEPIFRSWYITGALLGGAPLAQGTVYLMFSRKTADRMAIVAFSYVVIAAIFVLIAPVDATRASDHILSGKVFDWRWVRLFSPFINTYAFIFLVGGAAASAFRYWRTADSDRRALGNILIAVGALLPGIGGAYTRAGYTEVLYVTEFIGLILIYFGYRLNVGERPADVLEPVLEGAPLT